MPEGDTIFRAAVTLNRALAGQIVTNFETQLAQLSDVDVAGRRIEKVDAAGKWMRMYFSGDLILLTHMRMNGSWHIYRAGEKWQRPRIDMRIAIHTAPFVAVGFNVPVAEFHTAKTLARQPSLQNLGPDLLAEDFDAAEAVAQLRSRPDLEIGTALLCQSLLAGLGNVYKSEVCFAAKVHPFRKVETLSAEEVARLVAQARRILKANAATGPRRTTGRLNPAERLWVYARRGEPCRICGTPIEAKKDVDARITFWCPACQSA